MGLATRRERARLGVDDEADAALTVERDPFGPVLATASNPTRRNR
jgi:hypothetical protein